MIFTTNDIWQLSNELLRRDEIWLVDKDQDGVSDLYSLADLRMRMETRYVEMKRWQRII